VQEKGGPLAGPKKTEPVVEEAPAKKVRTKKAQ
jgi:hypothetical protein